MGARAVAVKQADITRAVRALKAAGAPAVRVVFEGGRVVVEPKEGLDERREKAADEREPIIL